MKVKILQAANSEELEREINEFLEGKSAIKVIDIKEIKSERIYIFMIIYEVL